MITSDEKKLFKSAAYDAIKQQFKKQPLSKSLQNQLEASSIGKQQSGIFVTIKLKNQLKGCIGCITSDNPLCLSLPYFAIQTAFNDQRFEPLTEAEFEEIKITLSILSPPLEIDRYETIKIGIHGIIFEYDNHKSVFLPEVPIEQNWDLETTLKQLEKKANAPFGSWKTANYKVFESIKF